MTVHINSVEAIVSCDIPWISFSVITYPPRDSSRCDKTGAPCQKKIKATKLLSLKFTRNRLLAGKGEFNGCP